MDKDPTQTFEKLYKVAEETIKALALHLNLKTLKQYKKRQME